MTSAINDMIDYVKKASSLIDSQREHIIELRTYIEKNEVKNKTEINSLKQELKQYKTKYGKLTNEEI